MTEIPTIVTYSGDGTQTDFVFPFAYLDAAHIISRRANWED